MQIKSGSGYKVEWEAELDHFGVNVGSKYIKDHIPRWKRILDPVVCIYVDPETNKDNPDAWWTDLKEPSSYSNTNRQVIVFQKKNKIRMHSKGEFHTLCQARSDNQSISSITLSRADVGLLGLAKPIKQQAREIYVKWQQEPLNLRQNPTLGEITVNRVGWRHITRKGRSIERIIQSWQLLGAARRIIQDVSDINLLGRVKEKIDDNGNKIIKDYLGLRSMIVFPHRDSSLVQVVLRRKRTIAPDGKFDQKVWFYSVYELRRGK